ncbi:MAG: hypothetical protein AB7O24_08330 [Kofleriaceae bacterium]
MRSRRYRPIQVSDRAVALFVECGDLVLAVEAEFTVRILLANETVVRPPEKEGFPSQVDSGAGMVPAWDLQEMLGWPGAGDSWLVVRAPRSWPFHAFALRTGRCLAVRPMPSVTTLPHAMFQMRGRAFPAGFRSHGIPELEAFPTGVVLDPTQLLTREEIDRGAASVSSGVGAHEAAR